MCHVTRTVLNYYVREKIISQVTEPLGLSRVHAASLLEANGWSAQMVRTILRNGTERNDGLNYGTERFLKLKLATYHC